MKYIMTLLILILSSNYAFAASPVKFECHPIENSHGVNDDFMLSVKGPSWFWTGEIFWTRLRDDFVTEYEYVDLEKNSQSISVNDLVRGKTFVKIENNSSIIIVSSKDEIYIEKSLFKKGTDEGLVYQYKEERNLLDITGMTKTTFNCVRQ